MHINKWFAAALMLAVSCCDLRPSSAAIRSPYVADANTVHLWHFDEPATTSWNAADRPYPQDASGVLNPWRLDQCYADSTYQGGFMAGPNTGYSGYGGAGALRIGGDRFEFRKGRTMWGAPPNGTTQSTRENSVGLLGSTTGPFTIEGLIKPQQTGAIIGAPGDDDPSRLTVSLQNTLANPTFAIGLPNSDNFTTTASIPGILPDTWYHWAVTFEGNNSGGSPAKLYWTKMEDSATTATLVQTFTSTRTQSY
ncbi:MAG: LamG domain-containing protein, partial [Planctomycetes bacterium]|nr:LamG domain-containing protein [Planctomycetota bacterium]